MRRLYNRFEDWANNPLFPPRAGRSLNPRRIDVLIALFGAICVGYYGWMEGLLGAAKGALAYAFVVMVALWLL
jgi:hypothetical protein